ncbi:PACE efflux transporter [Pelistega sp. NLN82]|uniref:PACE efflux transporter n=1 Tax=Pelistega ratti TaxID=2652177 RepID=A0A6L9Y7Q7_9BURK|nr:PACE efflux transporter [Pelistega ratti]NEN75867.1 PACE efflux transporter [Pelistega ratti]
MEVWERIFHSVLFEIGAMAVGAIVVLLAGDFSLEAATGTGIAIAIIAMVLNFIFNYIFDKCFPGKREDRGLKLRLLHMICFEGTLLIFTIPIIAYLLNLNLWHAFLADIGLSLIIMLYAFVFNWLYDIIRAKLIQMRTKDQ